MDSSVVSSSAKWVVFACLTPGVMLDYLTRTLHFSIIPLLRRDLQISNFHIGLLGTAFLWPYALLSPVAGFLGDRVSRRTVVIATLGVWSLVMALGGLANSPWQLVVLRGLLAVAVAATLGVPAVMAIGLGRHVAILILGLLLMGLLQAGFDVNWLPMICDTTLPHQRATAYGLINLAATFGGGASSLVTALIMKKFGLGVVLAGLAPMFMLIGGVLVFGAFRYFSPAPRGVELEAVGRRSS